VLARVKHPNPVVLSVAQQSRSTLKAKRHAAVFASTVCST
jgi:hypothetical protein